MMISAMGANIALINLMNLLNLNSLNSPAALSLWKNCYRKMDVFAGVFSVIALVLLWLFLPDKSRPGHPRVSDRYGDRCGDGDQ